MSKKNGKRARNYSPASEDEDDAREPEADDSDASVPPISTVIQQAAKGEASQVNPGAKTTRGRRAAPSSKTPAPKISALKTSAPAPKSTAKKASATAPANPAKKGRTTGSINYEGAEMDMILDVVEGEMPIGPDGWDRVAAEYNRWATRSRTYPSRPTRAIRAKFENVRLYLHLLICFLTT